VSLFNRFREDIVEWDAGSLVHRKFNALPPVGDHPFNGPAQLALSIASQGVHQGSDLDAQNVQSLASRDEVGGLLKARPTGQRASGLPTCDFVSANPAIHPL